MVAPNIIPRSQHSLSRQRIDPDALKVLYRLHQAGHVAYLVGGGVRDLLLDRRPKDFDIGTSAHPYEVKHLFRNCWIIGRRFRLAHVRFGQKVIEVATFRRQVPAGSEEEPPTHPASLSNRHAAPLSRDNTFGTPEEDAFRRDFTVNALFYDIGTFGILDYVGGLEDLEARVIRCIGDPDHRFPEDPVRMFRAVILGSRLEFSIDSDVRDGIARHRQLIVDSAPARLTEEYYKILRTGAANRTFKQLATSGLLDRLTPELSENPPDGLWLSLERLDTYRQRFEAFPDSLTNAVLIGSIVAPLGFSQPPIRRNRQTNRRPRSPQVQLGMLPLPRRDMDELREILDLQPKLLDVGATERAQHALRHRRAFTVALTWLEIHGGAPEIVDHWKHTLEADAPQPQAPRPKKRRRRRRRPPAETDRGKTGEGGEADKGEAG